MNKIADNRVWKRAICIFLVIELLALCLGITSYLNKRSFDGRIERPKFGELEDAMDLTMETTDSKQDIRVVVSPKNISSKEAKSLIGKAKKEIDSVFIGKNKSLSQVSENPVISDSYQNGYVNASWKFSDYNLIDTNGQLIRENIKEDSLVKASCTLSCGDVEETYEFTFVITLPDVRTEKGFNYLLDQKLDEIDESTKDKEYYVLPDALEGLKLSWMPKSDHREIELALFGIVAGVTVIAADKLKQRQENKKTKVLLERDYPDIVSALSLYVGAGLSLKKSVEKISSDYMSKRKRGEQIRPGYEGILKLNRQINDGKGELESLRDFGKWIGHRDYRKLSIILSQNIRKGTANLCEQLEKEEQQAFEERKIRAKVLGEEASTKLLIPMMGLLMIVLVVLIFPAILGMGL